MGWDGVWQKVESSRKANGRQDIAEREKLIVVLRDINTHIILRRGGHVCNLFVGAFNDNLDSCDS